MGAVQIGWMFSRVSSRLAQSLSRDVQAGLIRGHHEAIVGPYCSLQNYAYSWISPSRIGSILFGHKWGRDEKSLDVSSFDPHPGTLLHPVKCIAYYHPEDAGNIHPPHKTIEKDLKTWA